MRLYLVRHGKAQPHSQAPSDEERSLVQHGQEQANWLGRHLAEAHPPVSTIYASPARRTTQTAQLIAEQLPEPRPSLVRTESLGLHTTPSAVIELIHQLPQDSAVVLVGHNPTMSHLASILCSGPAAAKTMSMKTGQMVVLDCHDPSDPVGHCQLMGIERLDTVAHKA